MPFESMGTHLAFASKFLGVWAPSLKWFDKIAIWL